MIVICILLCFVTLYLSLQADGDGLAISISLVGNDVEILSMSLQK